VLKILARSDSSTTGTVHLRPEIKILLDFPAKMIKSFSQQGTVILPARVSSFFQAENFSLCAQSSSWWI